VQPLISPAGRGNSPLTQAGFTLIEIVCVMAILALLAVMAAPMLPMGTSRTRLESYAVQTAALLKADRYSALRRQAQVATVIDAGSRLIRSGATNRFVRVPNDVQLDALLPERCGAYPAGSTIRFFASGLSCGGVITLTHAGFGYEVHVIWLTGGIEIVPHARS
jgi:general secretion pathway protein H